MRIILYLLLFLAFGGCAKNPARENVDGWVISISPDSEKILVLQKSNDVRELVVTKADNFTPVFRKMIGNPIFLEATFISDNEILVVSDSIDFQVINVFNSKSRFVNDLDGIRPSLLHADYENEVLYLIDSGIHSVESKIFKFFLGTGQLEVYAISKNLNWVFGIAPKSKNELYANVNGFLSILNLETGDISQLSNQESETIDIGESTINLFAAKQKLLFSIPAKEIVEYDLNNGRMKVLPKFGGFLYPRLSPNENFFFANNGNKAPFHSKWFKFN